MEHILHDSHNIFIDEQTKLIVKKDDIEIYSTNLPLPDFNADSINETQETIFHEFSDNDDLCYELILYAEFGSITYDLYCDEYNENCTINLVTDSSEFFVSEKSYINTYVPLIKYTQKTKELIEKTVSSASNKDIFPLIDIRKEKNIKKYIEDDFKIAHFLDLCDLTIVINEEERENIKRYKKEHRGEENLPELPLEEEVSAYKKKIIDSYIDLKTKVDFIPVYRIDTKYPSDLEYFKNVIELLKFFKSIAIRVINHENFILNIQSYLAPFLEVLDNSYIIIEFSGINDKEERNILNYMIALNTGMQIIYVKETTDFQNYKIHINKKNIFPNTSLSSYIDRLSDSSSNIWYSDYCGYDRDTAIDYIIGMKPSASLYLLDKNDALQILVLKIKDSSERGTAAWSKSMNSLIDIIKVGSIDKNFLDISHCEACKELATLPKQTLASTKFLSMLHNCITLARI
ncbi:hypothetical protein [Aliarcobacter butzleri]|uniref:DUF2779 domain-containing protein n=1 Tax=Aliarcobacter butzleri TaxID=28197 RepID=A0AAW6VIR8_9BACT|nr:hypothetical protein [Aliarcobacter butzleri]MDK2042084.1 hypothetical protein [Aliarcobacter butzleri]MDK2097303.1 hypothetical protein [Aliarcobacter butzleri]